MTRIVFANGLKNISRWGYCFNNCCTWRPWGDHLTPKGAHLALRGDHLESSWGQLPQVAENIRNHKSFCMLTQPGV